MTERSLALTSEHGLHARPAGTFVKLASTFKSSVTVTYQGKKANGKSLMALMSLGLTRDAHLTITAEGTDENEAVSNLADLVARNFVEA